MRQASRTTIAVALAAAVATCSAGCSGHRATGPVGDQVTALTRMSGSATTVTLDSQTLGFLRGLGLTLSATGTARLSRSALRLPITSGYVEIHSDRRVKPGWIQGQVEHDTSGIALSAGSTTVTLSNFVVDPGASMLYGTINGATAREPLFALDGRAVEVDRTADAVTLTGTQALLTQTTASALNGAFRTNAVQAGRRLGAVRLEAAVEGGLPSPVATFAAAEATNLQLTGMATSLTLAPATVAQASGLQLTVGTTGSATSSVKGGATVLSFPVTGGFLGLHAAGGKAGASGGATAAPSADPTAVPTAVGSILGSVNHEASGLTVSAGGTTVTFDDLVLDPGSSVVTARIPDGRGGGSVVPLFTFPTSHFAVSVDSSGDAVLSGVTVLLGARAASALDSAFSTSAFRAGAAFGSLSVVTSTGAP